MTHEALVHRCAQWLHRQGYCIVAPNQKGSCIEQPDVIGWRVSGHSAIIECKTSRSDFKADAKKFGRGAGSPMGLGNLRWYACESDLIKPDELPQDWGLLYVLPSRMRQAVKPQAQECYVQAERSFLVQLVRYGAIAGWKESRGIRFTAPKPTILAANVSDTPGSGVTDSPKPTVGAEAQEEKL